jgi:acetyl esterase/lipase
MLLFCLLIAPCVSIAEVPLRESVMHPLPLPEVMPMREVADQTYLGPAKAEYAYDLYVPGGGKPPLVLMIHGGAPAAAGLRKAPLMRSWAMQIAARSGAAVAAIGWDGDKQLTDQIDAAYAKLRARADEYGIDASRPCILTFSAGVASVLPYALGDNAISPRCLVGLYGDWEPAMRALSGDARGLPVLVVRAGRDEVVPDTSAPAFVAAAEKAGVKVEVLRHPAGLHVFEVRNPGETTTHIVSQTLDFLRTHAGAQDAE